jgi:hypothetical protein
MQAQICLNLFSLTLITRGQLIQYYRVMMTRGAGPLSFSVKQTRHKASIVRQHSLQRIRHEASDVRQHYLQAKL